MSKSFFLKVITICVEFAMNLKEKKVHADLLPVLKSVSVTMFVNEQILFFPINDFQPPPDVAAMRMCGTMSAALTPF